MKTFTLALRNILRNKRRTLLTLLAIASGVTAITVFGGFIEYAFFGLREATIRTQLGHVQIYRQGYAEHALTDPVGYLLPDPEQIEKALAGLPHINTVTRRLTFQALVTTGSNSLSAMITGVMPEREDELAAFETVLDGQPLGPDTPDGAVIGVELAKALGAKPGNYLTIMSTTLGGVINAVEVQVVGIAQTGSQEYDSVFVKVPLAIAQRALDTTAVEKLLVLFDDTDQLDALLPPLRAALAQAGLAVEYRRWEELAIYYNKVVALYRGLFNVITAIIAVIVLFSIVNTMTMSVFERIREIGTLRAIGANRPTIMRLFLTEGALLGVCGALLGILAGIAVAVLINLSGGIPISAPPGMSRGYLSLILIVPWILLYSFVFAVALALLSSAWPAWKASHVKVVEALAHA